MSMSIARQLSSDLAECIGAADLGNGVYRLDFDGFSRAATGDEVLAAQRVTRWEDIKTERDRRTQEQGYAVAGKRFHSDIFSRTQQIGLVMLGQSLPPDLQWKTMDGSFVTMTPTLAQQVFGAAAASDIALFAYSQELKAQVEVAADPASIDILTGWPE